MSKYEESTLLSKENCISSHSSIHTTIAEELSNEESEVRLEVLNKLMKEYASKTTAARLKQVHEQLKDPNIEVRERGLDLLIGLKSTIPSEVLDLLIENCLVSTSAQLKAKAMDCVLTLAEYGSMHSSIITSIEKALCQSVKVALAGLNVLTSLLTNFGNKCFPIEGFAEIIAKLVDSDNAQIRMEAMNYLKEAYRWNKGIVETIIKKVESFEQSEMDKVFMESKEQPTAIRFVKLNEESELLPSKAQKAISMDNIEDTEQVLKVLKESLQSSNTQHANMALQSITQLSKVKTKCFPMLIKELIINVLEKYSNKETVMEAMNCMNSLLPSLKLEELATGIERALHKEASAKIAVCSWLESSILPTIPSLDVFTPLLQRLSVDPSKEVREAALNCIRTKKIHELQIKDENELSKNKLESESTEGITAKIDSDNQSLSKSISLSTESKVVSSKKQRKRLIKLNRSSAKTNKLPFTDASMEEDVGPMMTLETSTKLVYENVPPYILALFDMTEIKKQQRGVQSLSDWIKEDPNKAQQAMEAIVIWLKRKTADFKEGNITETLQVIKAFCGACEIDKRFAREVVPPITERMSNLRLHKECIQTILCIIDSVSSIYVSTLIMKTSFISKNFNVIKGSIVILTELLEKYGPGLLPAKITIEYAKYYLTSKNSTIYTAAVNYIVLTYKAIGDTAKPWIYNGLKESLAKTIEGELAKIVPEVEARISKNETIELRAQLVKAMGTTGVDISLLITNKILAGLSHTSTKQRQEAKDAIEKILEEHNRIKGIGLTPLMNCLKERMNESNKKLAKSFIALVGNLAEAMGEEFAEYCGMIVESLVYCLADKQAAIRSETMTTMDKIASAVGPEHILNLLGPALEKGNFEMRNALLIWIIKNSDSLITANEKSLIKPLVTAMQDKSKEIRMLSEQVIQKIVKDVGQEAFIDEVQDIRLLEKSNLMSLFTKYRVRLKENERPMIIGRNIKHKTLNPLEAAICNTVIDKSMCLLKPSKEQRKPSVKNSRGGLNSTLVRPLQKQKKRLFSNTIHSSTSNLKGTFERRPKSKLNDFKRVSNKLTSHSKPLSKSTSKNSLNYSNTLSELHSVYKETIVLSCLGNKDKRNEGSRWPINEIKKDYVENLRKILKNHINPLLFELMFSMEVKKNLKAISTLKEGLKTEFTAMLDLLDLFSKWITIRLIDQTNVLFIKRVLEFLEDFFNEMIRVSYQLYDFEAVVIIPILCEKLGISNEVVKHQIREILRLLLLLHPPAKVANNVVWVLDTTKNKKTKLECLLFINELIRKYPADEICSLKNVKSITKYVVSVENALRNEALEVIFILYKAIGRSLWIILGELPENIKMAINKRLEPVNLSEQKPINTRRPLSSRGSDLEGSLRSCPWRKPQGSDIKTPQTSDYTNTKGKVIDLPFRTNKDNFLHKAGDKPIRSLENALEVIRHGEISRRVDALMYLNEIVASNLEEEKKFLITHCDQLLNCFSEVLDEIFNNRPEDIPIRFAKYFMTVVSKICSCQYFISEVSEQSFTTFAEQLLTKLLYEGLEQLGDSNEGQYLVKALNSTMLKILECYDPTKVFVALINLFKCYRNAPPCMNRIRTGRLPGLIVKCMLKMVKTISSTIEVLEPPRILLALHEYLLLNPSTSLPKSANDDIGIRISKTIIYELINARGEAIWEDYKLIELHEKPDLHIRRWISLLLKSSYPVSSSPATLPSKESLKEILKKLSTEQSYQQGIEELTEYSEKHPDIDLTPYLATIPKPFQERIKNMLEEHQEESVEEVLESVVEVEPSASVGSLSEYKSKLSLLKQKFAIGISEE